MKVSFTHRAEEGEVFAPDAFTRSIGQTVAVSYPGGDSGTGTLLDAVVSEDGRSAEIKLEVHDR